MGGHTKPQLYHNAKAYASESDKTDDRSKHIPETCITLGKYTFPSILESILTPAQAVRYGSRATRMIQRFVVGEKYLTVHAVHHATTVRRSHGDYGRLRTSRGITRLDGVARRRGGGRTRKRSSDSSPACITKVENDTLSERVEDALAVEFLV